MEKKSRTIKTNEKHGLVESLLKKAQASLNAAKRLFEEGLLEDSASRSYYAMFHAARAALADIDVSARTHEGVVSTFGKKLVLEDVYPKSLGKAFADSKAARETYEYSTTDEISREEAEMLLGHAETFVQTISRKLQKKKQ